MSLNWELLDRHRKFSLTEEKKRVYQDKALSRLEKFIKLLTGHFGSFFETHT